MTLVLDVPGIAALMVERGVVAVGATAVELSGGVSNTVVLVEDGARRVVVKQSLPQLKVTDEWLAKRDRLLTEAAALEVAGTITPGLVPGVISVVADQYVVAIEAAPPHWDTWKRDLLHGTVDHTVAQTLGTALGQWHAATAGDDAIARRFDDQEAFEQLRVDPYYRTVARRAPDVMAGMDALIERMAATQLCLVHGDFSPKNVLVGDGRVWMLDWEVAHVGDPAFDIAFMTNHLVLKGIHRGDTEPYRAAARLFWSGYEAARGVVPFDGAHTATHLGALLMARAIGKSPAEYLDAAGRDRAAALGRSLLLDPPSTLDDVWDCR